MDEYTRLYQLYLNKSNSELQEIINSRNGYKEAAIKAATVILQERGIEYQDESNETVAKHEETIKHDDIITLPKTNKKYPSWLIAIATICCLATCLTAITGIFNLTHTSQSDKQINQYIKGGIYEGAGDFFGLIFYFYDENTFAFSTASGEKISYGTYETDGNAIALGISSEIYYAVSLNNGQKIMISNSQLSKITDAKSLKEYKEKFISLE